MERRGTSRPCNRAREEKPHKMREWYKPLKFTSGSNMWRTSQGKQGCFKCGRPQLAQEWPTQECGSPQLGQECPNQELSSSLVVGAQLEFDEQEDKQQWDTNVQVKVSLVKVCSMYYQRLRNRSSKRGLEEQKKPWKESSRSRWWTKRSRSRDSLGGPRSLRTKRNSRKMCPTVMGEQEAGGCPWRINRNTRKQDLMKVGKQEMKMGSFIHRWSSAARATTSGWDSFVNLMGLKLLELWSNVSIR